mmetsp:Transcript_29459/g.96169  ORF Transcript_29459/g.96169 Transcript_29459/m.96169 type:complete len:419 (+) Transcript_29459:1629-2885(+)
MHALVRPAQRLHRDPHLRQLAQSATHRRARLLHSIELITSHPGQWRRWQGQRSTAASATATAGARPSSRLHHDPARLQCLLQLLDLLAQRANQLLCRVFVHDRLVLDLLHAVGVAQRAQRFRVVDRRGRDGGDHGGLRVSAQRVLEQLREHGGPVGHALLLLGGGVAVLGQRGDHVAKRGQRLVDCTALLELLARCASAFRALRPSQIDQVDDGHLLGRLPRVLVYLELGQDELEDGVGAGGGGVHVGGRDRARLVALLHQLLHRIEFLHRILRQSLDVEADLGVHAHFQVPSLWVEQVSNFLHVHLQHGALHRDGQIWVIVGANAVEDLARGDGDDATAWVQRHSWISHHTVRLASARLPIGEQAHVVALVRLLEHPDANVPPHLLLRAVGRRRRVERVVREVERELVLPARLFVPD